MSGFLRRLFARTPAQHPEEAECPPRAVGKNAMLAAGYGKPKLRRFKIEGKVVKDSEAGSQVLAHGGCVREAESAEALKAAWERDMKIAFPMGADYNVDYWCEVTPLDDEPADESDDNAVKAAIAAEVGAVTMF